MEKKLRTCLSRSLPRPGMPRTEPGRFLSPGLCGKIAPYSDGRQTDVAYSELIKNFERIRGYMREFYVYGFKGREEYTEKSPRSYDNERRRLESWLGEHMEFRQTASGKQVFLSVDSRSIPHNPLHRAFKAKSFTARDITLHFYILDLLADGRALNARQMIEEINDRYLSRFETAAGVDESTLRKKLREYEVLGLVCSEKKGRELFWRRADTSAVDLESWADALAFFAQEDPLGVIGSFLGDRLGQLPDVFRFKHHYILHALDSDVLCDLVLAIGEHRTVELTIVGPRTPAGAVHTVCPLKIYISTQTGRQYLLAYRYRQRRMGFFRLDTIHRVKAGPPDAEYARYTEQWAGFDRHLWGVSMGKGERIDHIEMTLRYGPEEGHIPQRLEREKRHGRVEYPEEGLCRFSADVYDAQELLPWIRTFVGRITDLQCSDPTVTQCFWEDLERMSALYGGEDPAIQ